MDLFKKCLVKYRKTHPRKDGYVERTESDSSDDFTTDDRIVSSGIYSEDVSYKHFFVQ